MVPRSGKATIKTSGVLMVGGSRVVRALDGRGLCAWAVRPLRVPGQEAEQAREVLVEARWSETWSGSCRSEYGAIMGIDSY
jgi:hypothetical protein